MIRPCLAAFAAILLLACTISPVVTDPMGGSSGGRYDDCRRAAREYCKHVPRAENTDTDECVAQQTFRCVAGAER